MKIKTLSENNLTNFSSKDGWQLTTPIAFIIFNRPDTTQKVFNAIREAKPPKLLVIADGTRVDKEGEAELCKQTRAIIDQVDWDCEVLTNYSDVNLGCRKRVSSGLDWVFERVEEAIILEDDCLPHPTFFHYCQELLEKYRDNEKVMIISGDNAHGYKDVVESYYFTRYSLIWGWATWKRAWQKYDDDMKLWLDKKNTNWLQTILNNPLAGQEWTYKFQKGYEKDNSCAWDRAWMFALWSNNGLCIVPKNNLISNIGYGENSTHTKIKDWRADAVTEPIQFPLIHPTQIRSNQNADDFIETFIFSGTRRYYYINQIKEKLNNHLNKEALQLLDAVMKYKPIINSLYYGKAICLGRLGEIKEAVENLQYLLKINPYHQKAKFLLQELIARQK